MMIKQQWMVMNQHRMMMSQYEDNTEKVNCKNNNTQSINRCKKQYISCQFSSCTGCVHFSKPFTKCCELIQSQFITTTPACGISAELVAMNGRFVPVREWFAEMNATTDCDTLLLDVRLKFVF